MKAADSWRNNRASCLVSLLLLAATARPACIYVDACAPPDGDGVSWEQAFDTLQEALIAARPGDEVRIAQGVYTPDLWGYPNVSFELRNGITVRGGYAGMNAADPDARDLRLYKTVFSGDLLGNDIDPGPRLRGEALWAFMEDASRADNAYHVVTAEGTDHSAVLDGVVITGGNARGTGWDRGGGLHGMGGRPTLIDCTFVRNSARYGGALDNYDTEVSAGDAGPVLIRCAFVENAAVEGGAIDNNEASPQVIDCTFVGNTAERGGAISGDSYEPLTRCVFVENSAVDREQGAGLYAGCGGAVYHVIDGVRAADCVFVGNSAVRGGAVYSRYSASPLLERVLFAGNTAEVAGGALFVKDFVTPRVLNCTFEGNSAVQGAAVACEPKEPYNHPRRFVVSNCILRDGGSELYCSQPDMLEVSFSDVEGGFGGVGNVDVDPLFVNPGRREDAGTPDNFADDVWVGGDYHLKSQAGRWDVAQRCWIQDDVTSLCIDAGDPMSAIMYEPFPNGGIVNMGAYGGTAEASKSWFGGPVCEKIVAGDINGDCAVDLADLAMMAVHWLEKYNY